MYNFAVACKKGLSQRELEKLSSVSASHYQNGKKDVNAKIDTIMIILLALMGKLSISF